MALDNNNNNNSSNINNKKAKSRKATNLAGEHQPYKAFSNIPLHGIYTPMYIYTHVWNTCIDVYYIKCICVHVCVCVSLWFSLASGILLGDKQKEKHTYSRHINTLSLFYSYTHMYLLFPYRTPTLFHSCIERSGRSIARNRREFGWGSGIKKASRGRHEGT